MNDRIYLLIKAALRLIALAIFCVPIYFRLEDNTILLAICTLLIIGIFFSMLRRAILDYQNKELDVIYNGFDLKGNFIYLVLWSAIITFSIYIYSSNMGFHYSYYGICFLLMTIQNGFRLIT